MTITWTVEISKVDVANERADVSFTRVDDVAGETETFTFQKVILGTAQQKTALLDLVWQNHLDNVTKKTAASNFIADLEATAKANLEAREV